MRRVTLLSLAICCCSYSQACQDPNLEYQTPALRERAASEMGHWFRPSVEHTDELVPSFDLRRGDAIADVGIRIGYLHVII